MRWSAPFLVICFATLSVGVASGPGEAAGPWRAQVVDAETGQLLEGVVVLAIWYRRYTSPGGWAGGGYYDSEEVVTGPDGRFVIQARSTWTLLPFVTTIKGPYFWIFKPGYGAWQRFMEEAPAAKFFEMGEEIVIRLPPLKTQKERLDFLSRPDGEIPPERMRKYLEALDQERINLGLKPGYVR